LFPTSFQTPGFLLFPNSPSSILSHIRIYFREDHSVVVCILTYLRHKHREGLRESSPPMENGYIYLIVIV
jgi:hypothetical protein